MVSLINKIHSPTGFKTASTSMYTEAKRAPPFSSGNRGNQEDKARAIRRRIEAVDLRDT